jgi:hypothetical protein
MSGSLPYEGPLTSRGEEIKTKLRLFIEKYSKILNLLVDRMLTIDIKDRITID